MQEAQTVNNDDSGVASTSIGDADQTGQSGQGGGASASGYVAGVASAPGHVASVVVAAAPDAVELSDVFEGPATLDPVRQDGDFQEAVCPRDASLTIEEASAQRSTQDNSVEDELGARELSEASVDTGRPQLGRAAFDGELQDPQGSVSASNNLGSGVATRSEAELRETGPDQAEPEVVPLRSVGSPASPRIFPSVDVVAGDKPDIGAGTSPRPMSGETETVVLEEGGPPEEATVETQSLLEGTDHLLAGDTAAIDADDKRRGAGGDSDSEF